MTTLKTKPIDFSNKDITGTEWYFSFQNKNRPEDWTMHDEIILLSLYLQKDVVGHESGKPIHTIMNWRQNVSKAINKTLDKLKDDHIFRGLSLVNWQDFAPTYESYCHKLNINGDITLVYALKGNNGNGGYVLTEEGSEEAERDKILHEAKELAKAEILAEQERQKAIEEAEAEEQAETEDVDIVIPFRNYGK
ncbi:hypothetical protein N9O15_03880 [Gammaproteobacteria bacterium]|nr:hypothetical protein [Gammaproteobacteria bacterium]